jgi:hypothetical protein
MKRKSIALLAVVAALGSLASTAGARSGSITFLSFDLTLRPGVSQAGHPAIAPRGFFGGGDATYNPGTSLFAYSLDYKGLAGSVLRVRIRSRATGAVYATVCDPCHPVSAGRGHEGLPVSHLGGRVTVDPDAGFLIARGRTFLEVDTTAYPAGEIGGPILPPPVFTHPVTKPGGVTETPRCC